VVVKLVPYIPLLPEDKKDARAHEVRQGYDGMCERKGKRFLIQLAMSPNTPRAHLLDTLLHEWAHARAWRHETIERAKADYVVHDNEYWAVYGEIYRRFYDFGGFRETWEF
jgi:hypothetical protein